MIRLKKRNYILYGIGALLIFLMIFIPGTSMGVKIILFFSLLMVMVATLFANDMSIVFSHGVFVWFCVYIASSIFYTLLSVLYQNPHALNNFNVKVLEPFLIMFIIGAIRQNHFNFIRKTLLVTTLIVTVYNVIFFLCINDIILPASYAEYFTAAFINYGGVSFGMLKFASQSLSWLIYLIPMYMAISLLPNDYSKREKSMVLLCVIFGILNAVLSMRTAFLLAIIATPMILLIMSWICRINLDKKKITMASVFIAVFCIIALLLFRDQASNVLSGLVEKVTVSFSSKRSVNEYGIVDNGGSIRKEQIADLLYTWQKKPMLGWGDSANSLNIIRSESSSGAYEMNYFALLMQRGIVGFLLFWFQIFYIFFECAKIVRRRKQYHVDVFGMMIGLITFLMANATNPYLDSFDRLMILFLPLALINMNKKKQLDAISITFNSLKK